MIGDTGFTEWIFNAFEHDGFLGGDTGMHYPYGRRCFLQVAEGNVC